MLGHAMMVHAGRGTDRDVRRVARPEIDRVVPHPRPGNHPQFRQVCDHARRVRLGPGNHRFRIFEHRNQGVFLKHVRFVVHLLKLEPALLENLDVRAIPGVFCSVDALRHVASVLG